MKHWEHWDNKTMIQWNIETMRTLRMRTLSQWEHWVNENTESMRTLRHNETVILWEHWETRQWEHWDTENIETSRQWYIENLETIRHWEHWDNETLRTWDNETLRTLRQCDNETIKWGIETLRQWDNEIWSWKMTMSRDRIFQRKTYRVIWFRYTSKSCHSQLIVKQIFHFLFRETDAQQLVKSLVVF